MFAVVICDKQEEERRRLDRCYSYLLESAAAARLLSNDSFGVKLEYSGYVVVWMLL